MYSRGKIIMSNVGFRIVKTPDKRYALLIGSAEVSIQINLNKENLKTLKDVIEAGLIV
jgi:hypothetical protein